MRCRRVKLFDKRQVMKLLKRRGSVRYWYPDHWASKEWQI